MRVALIVGGVLFMGFGVLGAVTDPDINLVGVPLFLIAVLILLTTIVHDAIFLPVAIGAGALVNRVVPAAWRATVRVAGTISLAVSVVAVPMVLGFGRSADDASVLPGNYGPGLAGVLALV
jgi:hypothetical protein